MPNEKVKYFKPYVEIKEKIKYVKDKDLLGYNSANIYAFTFNLFRLKKFGLSNNFIYMDDDFFIGKKLKKSDFFYYEKDEKRVVPSLLNKEFHILNREKTISKYNGMYKIKEKFISQGKKCWSLSLLSTEKFFLDFFPNKTIINPKPTHNAISFNIQDSKEIYELILNNYRYANETLNSLTRHVLTLQTQHFYDLFALNCKHRKVHTLNFTVMGIYKVNLRKMYYDLFAINTGADRNYTIIEFQKAKELMKKRFPNPTQYEILKTTSKIQKHEEKKTIDLKKNYSKFNEINNKEIHKSNKRQSLFIKLYNCLILLLILIIIFLFYLYWKEKKKNDSKNYYKRKTLIKYNNNPHIII